VTRAPRFTALALAVAFLALHLPYLPASLEDLDSINFALGIRDFDVASHQPHPPGYPLFILAAKAVHLVVPSETHALALLSILAGACGVLAIVALFRTLDEGADRDLPNLVAAALAVTSPLYWITSARPLSDLLGLAAVLAVQALILRARTARSLVVAAFCAALAAGIRSQAVWLTAPLLLFAFGRYVLSTSPGAIRLAVSMAGGYLAGALAWLIPLVMLTGGPAEYLRVLSNQGAEDFTGVVMLWTTPTPRQLVRVLEAAFIAPWSFIWTAAIVLVLAAAGLLVMLRWYRPALLALAAAFGPYLVFDLIFQESATTRYALPLVVPVAYGAAQGARAIRSNVLVAGLALLAGFNVFSGTLALSGYSAAEAPAFRLLDDMAASASRGKQSMPVLAMHRRDDFDLRRPIVWVGDRMAPFASRLPSPPKHEWLELVKYWNAGGRAPIWFVGDPPRSDLALIKSQRPPAQYRWPFSLPYVMGGVRPNEMDWHTIEPPDWYLGQGWALTPEAAGVSREDGRGPSRGGIEGWIRRSPAETFLVVGGRNLSADGTEVHLQMSVDGQRLDQISVKPGFFLHMPMLPPRNPNDSGDYAALKISAEPAGADLAIEQFDAAPMGARPIFGYDDGWNEPEYNPTTGRLWRWTTERATLRLRGPAGKALALRLDGEIEEASTSHVVIRAGDLVVGEHDVGRTFSISSNLPAAVSPQDAMTVTIETSAWYIPAERRWRSRDRRHLGLKIYSCVIVPIS
jgi:hypothetical protein